GLANGSINMFVNHAGIDYLVSGSLNILANENAIFDQFFNVIASTSAAGSACNPDCLTEIDGAFFGPGIDTNNTPQYIGLGYDIEETDLITGVAGFETITGLIQTPQQQLLTTTLTGVSIPGTLLFINQIADASLTGDPPTSIASLLQADFTGGASPDILTLVTAQNFDTFNDGTLFITRWSGGDITDVFNNGTPNTFTLTADKGVHLVLGIPTTSIPTQAVGGTATYNFIVGSATKTTHLAGVSNPGGITGGTIELNFFLAEAFPSIDILHDGETFNLTGPSAGYVAIPFQTLVGSATTQSGYFGSGEASSPSFCSSPCSASIGAVFAGDSSAGSAAGIGNIPAEIGVVFRINTNIIPDPFSTFTGAGGFKVNTTTNPPIAFP
ncbi:MAG: hypothetical protein O6928_02135, partial [Gammaproteobacteria bacterium]|nr:hypothetical protein [Gammaproteobacteria bacterium]